MTDYRRSAEAAKVMEQARAFLDAEGAAYSEMALVAVAAAYDEGRAAYDEEAADVARLTRERDAAMAALKRIKAMSAVAGYDFGDASIHNVARQIIHAIETGAIHNDQR